MATANTSALGQQGQELRNRILFTLFILILYRLGVHVPTPGLDGEQMSQFFAAQNAGIFGMLNTFTGGALEQVSVFALGIMPYISASIIMQLLSASIPHLEALKKEGEQGRRKIGQYTRYGTVVLAIIQGTAIANYLASASTEDGLPLVGTPYVGPIPFVVMTVLTLTAGAMFVVWLGEQITERGLGEGASVIIFAGIAASIPSGTLSLWALVSEGTIRLVAGLLIVFLMLLVVGLVIFLEMGQRRVPVHVSQKGGRLLQQQQSYLPLKINMSGVIPPIFASALLLFPATISNFVDAPWLSNLDEFLSPAGGLHNILFVGLIVFFCFFYTEIVFPPQDMADNLKKGGKFIPGIRAGRSTAEFIQRVINRITVAGAIYISLICVLPTILIAKLNVPFYFGGTSLLILVGVAMNLIEKVNAFRYESMMKSAAAVRTRRRRVQF